MRAKYLVGASDKELIKAAVERSVHWHKKQALRTNFFGEKALQRHRILQERFEVILSDLSR